MTLLSVFGIAILVAVSLLALREVGGRLAPLIAAAGGILLLTFTLGRTRAVIEALTSLGGGEAVDSALSLGVRVVGLAAITEVTAGVCRDLGEGGLATKVEWCGRAEILAVSLPALTRLIQLATASLG